MAEFSIITCISNPEIYKLCLLDSISKCRQNFDIEIIPIHNFNNLYSASNALNMGIDVATSNNLIFAHQDIKLLDNWFEILQTILHRVDENWGVIGSAGINLKYERSDTGPWGGSVDENVPTLAVGSVWSNDTDNRPYWDGSKEISKIHCADECLFVMNRRTGLRFDSTFTGFHFYGVDMCLQARAAGYYVFGAHLPIIHYGQYSASFSDDLRYWVHLRLLHNKWKLQFPEILGTHMHWAEDELTSYISTSLEDGCGQSIEIKAAGLKKVKLSIDRHFV